ncbi:MAG: LacI family DNA-binding transcriptional regulator, partial [Paracoccaceae bacterium]|nr:LacI family DNA-binding transcriptional regulator [Paracoccaceae bacterium]
MKPKLRLPDKKSKITLREVALNANVSESTVSRILRNEGPVAEDTRDKVMQSVRALGYVPNRIAGSLASLNTNLVGIVVPSLSNIVFPEVLNGINEGLSGRPQLQSVISVSEYDAELEESIVRNLLSWKPMAVLVTGFHHTEAARRMLQDCECRVVEMMETDGTPIDVAVGASHCRAGYETARHLIAKGYRRFGYIAHDISKDVRALLRFDGIAQALAESGLAFVADLRADQTSSVG